MKLNMYSIFDSAAQAFIPPFFMHNDGLAIRAFQDNVNSPEPNNISQHPAQFSLFKMGSFDDKSGVYELLDTPKSIALAVELVNEPTYSVSDVKHLETLVNELHTLVKQKLEN